MGGRYRLTLLTWRIVHQCLYLEYIHVQVHGKPKLGTGAGPVVLALRPRFVNLSQSYAVAKSSLLPCSSCFRPAAKIKSRSAAYLHVANCDESDEHAVTAVVCVALAVTFGFRPLLTLSGSGYSDTAATAARNARLAFECDFWNSTEEAAGAIAAESAQISETPKRHKRWRHHAFEFFL